MYAVIISTSLAIKIKAGGTEEYDVYDTSDLSFDTVTSDELHRAVKALGVDIFYNVAEDMGDYYIAGCESLPSGVRINAYGWYFTNYDLITYKGQQVEVKALVDSNSERLLLFRCGKHATVLAKCNGRTPNFRLGYIVKSRDIPWVFVVVYKCLGFNYAVVVDFNGNAHGIFSEHKVLLNLESIYVSDTLLADIAKLELIKGTGWWSNLLRG